MARHIMVLTGAGVSAESGIRTFRDGNGLWEEHRVEDVASPEGFRRDPALVWRFYSARREQAREVHPNEGHQALVAAEEALGDRFLLVTQNVDGLHRRAGSNRVVEMHGSLRLTRCSVCGEPPFVDESVYYDALPECRVCAASGRHALLRPHIVWFGEALDSADMERIESFIATAGRDLVFVAAGTSGAVYPAAGLVNVARAVGGRSVLVNLDSADNAHCFDEFRMGKSSELLPIVMRELVTP